MRGVPNNLKTRADYERIRDMMLAGQFGRSDKEKAIRKWEALLARHRWVFDKELDSEDDADSGDDYRVIRERDDETGEVTKIIQEKRVECSRAKINRIGLSVDEVEDAVSSMKEALNA